MSDRLHDHLTLGPRRGCVACAQIEADVARGARALAAADPARDLPEPAMIHR